MCIRYVCLYTHTYIRALPLYVCTCPHMVISCLLFFISLARSQASWISKDCNPLLVASITPVGLTYIQKHMYKHIYMYVCTYEHNRWISIHPCTHHNASTRLLFPCIRLTTAPSIKTFSLPKFSWMNSGQENGASSTGKGEVGATGGGKIHIEGPTPPPSFPFISLACLWCGSLLCFFVMSPSFSSVVSGEGLSLWLVVRGTGLFGLGGKGEFLPPPWPCPLVFLLSCELFSSDLRAAATWFHASYWITLIGTDIRMIIYIISHQLWYQHRYIRTIIFSHISHNFDT